jgi:hypothetical protein
MQEPTEEAEEVEAPIPTEIVSSGPDENLNQTVKVCRKAAKRTLPWDLATGELDLVPSPSQAEDILAGIKQEPLPTTTDEAATETASPDLSVGLRPPAAHLVSPPLPQAEDILVRKKRRFEEPLPTTTYEATRKTSSPDVSVGLPPYAADNDDVNVDPMMDTQPNFGDCVRVNRRWTANEDAKLASAVANTLKKKCGKKYTTDWDAVAVLVPDRTRNQCSDRWKYILDCGIDRANGRKGKWTAVEDSKLQDAVQTHGAKNWVAIAELVPGRASNQCLARWHNVLDPRIDQANRRSKWVEDEDIKLKDAVQVHGGKNWPAIAALVPGRTKTQCRIRWRDALDPRIDRANARTGKWAEDEDIKLKDAVQMHNGKNWDAIARLVPGRTEKQCCCRWHDALAPCIVQTIVLTGKWTEDEDTKLKDAMQTHDGNSWDVIAMLVPGRTKSQCRGRWKYVLDCGIDRVNGLQTKTAS